MRFTEEQGYLIIEIVVNRKSVWEFTTKTTFSEEYAKENNIDTVYDTICLKTNLQYSQNHELISRLNNILTIDLKQEEISRINLEVQRNEIVYLAYKLQRIRDNFGGLHKEDWKIKTFCQLITLKELQLKVNPSDGLKITIQQFTKDNNPTIELPAAKDTQELFKYISDAVYQYFVDSSESISLNFMLSTGYKEPITLNLLQKERDRLLSQPKRNENLILGNLIHSILPYLKRQPQFPSNFHRNNSILTEAQANFIDAFFDMFGFYSKSFEIILAPISQRKTYKQLRTALEQYRAKYISSENV